MRSSAATRALYRVSSCLPFLFTRARSRARARCAQDTLIAALQLLLRRVLEKAAPAEGDEAAAGAAPRGSEEAARHAVERPVPVRGPVTSSLFGDDSDAEPHEQLAATDADGTPITRVELACTEAHSALAAAAGLPCRALREEQRVVREAEVLGAVREAIPGELAKHAASEFTKAVTKFASAIAHEQPCIVARMLLLVSGEDVFYYAGLQFCVEQVMAVAHMLAPDAVFTARAAVGVAAVLEYLSAEVLEIAGKAARDNGSDTISVRHVFVAIRGDEELNAVFPDTADPGSLRQVLFEAENEEGEPRCGSMLDERIFHSQSP